jgi:hypothetical protein
MDEPKPISRQRRWQMKMLSRGNCPKCGGSRVNDACLCPKCLSAERDRQRKKLGCKKEYNSLSRRMTVTPSTSIPIDFTEAPR